jgi:nitric oxide reductase NorE protein
MMVFSLFFMTFMYYRSQNVPLYTASQTALSQFFGVLNTFYMLTSSWFVVMAVSAARRDWRKAASICFMLAFLCGAGFAVNKFFEYGEKIRHGITLNSNEFFMYYYVFTGIHFMHVIIGMGVLTFAARYAWRAPATPGKISNLESCASFWHVVDLLWIVLFAILYLIK